MYKSFKHRIIAMNFVLMLVFITAVSALFYYEESTTLISVAKSNSISATEFYANKIGSAILKYVNDLKYVANSPYLQSASKYDVLEELKYLQTSSDGEFIDIFVSSVDMRYVSANGSTGVINDHDYFDVFDLENRDHIISEPLYEQYEHMPAVLIIVPVKSEDENTRLILGGLVDLNALSGDFSSIKHAGRSYGWLINDSGLVMGHPNPLYPMKIMIQDTDDAGYPGLSAIGRTMLETDSGFGEYYDDLSSESKIVTYSTVPYTSGWKLAITTLKSDIYKPLTHLFYKTIALITVIFLLYVTLIYKQSTNMLKPLERVISAVENAEKITFEPIEDLESGDELGRLVKAYNRMTSNLKGYTENLEAIAEDRTNELLSLHKQLDKHVRRLSKMDTELYDLAKLDSLTGLLNHKEIMDEVRSNIKNVELKIAPYFSLMYIDIDNFKRFNDIFGHETGDRILEHFSKHLKAVFRSTDIIGRYSGDEFIVIMLNTSENDSLYATHNFKISMADNNEYLEKVKQLCHTASPSKLKNIHFSVSVGVVTYLRNNDKDAELLIAEAEKKMQRIKDIKKARSAT